MIGGKEPPGIYRPVSRRDPGSSGGFGGVTVVFTILSGLAAIAGAWVPAGLVAFLGGWWLLVAGPVGGLWWLVAADGSWCEPVTCSCW